MTDKFKEQFPSLDCYACGTRPEFIHGEGMKNMRVFSQTSIQKHCLDKQRAKEVITRIANQKPCPSDVLEELSKELGLD